MPETVGEAFVTIRPDTQNFGRDVGTQMSTGLKVAVAGLATGIVGQKVKSLFTSSIAEATEAAKVGAQTAAVIASTGGAAQVSAKQVGSYAEELSALSGIDDEVIQSSENMLLTFTNVQNRAGKGNDIFKQATALALDMSVAMGTDASGAALQLGKALNDPIQGVGALRRVGVQLSDAQEEQVKRFVEVNDIAGAQKLILAELAKEFAGSAAAQATEGEKAAVAWGNVKEAIGTGLLPVLNAALKIMTPIAKFLAQHKTLAVALAVAVGGVLVTAMAAYTVSMIAGAAATLAAAAPILGIIVVIGLLVAAAIFLAKNWDDVMAFVKNAATVAKDWIIGAFHAVIDFLKGLPGMILGVFVDAHLWLFDAGKAIIEGMLNGIGAAAGAIGGFLKRNVVDKVVGFVKSGFGIFSPSQVMEGLGSQVTAGFVKGMGGSDVTRALSAFTPPTLGASTAGGSTGTAAGMLSLTIAPVFNVAGNLSREDGLELTRVIQRETERGLRAAGVPVSPR